MIVVDASLVTKLILEEADTPEAIAWVQARAGGVCGPDLLLVEVAGAVVRRANERKLFVEQMLAELGSVLDGLSGRIIALEPITPRRVNAAAHIAVQLGHPLRDCIYLVLAMELNCELATCDVKFRDRAYLVHPRIRLLSDYAA